MELMQDIIFMYQKVLKTEVSHVNVNVGTCEGLRYKRPNCFTTQFHPEASPGPKDTEYLFDRFVASMGGDR